MRGFTLVELLITIAILAVLSAIGFISYAVVMNQGRDSKRMADLKIIQSALEQYYADQGYYPPSISSGDSIAFGSKTYLRQVPYDPINGRRGTKRYNYLYIGIPTIPTSCSGSSCTSYCIYATVENDNNANSTANSACVNYLTYNYEVSPP